MTEPLRFDSRGSAVAEAEGEPSYRVHLCFGPNCTPRGSRALLPVLEAAIAAEGIGHRVEIIASTCRDRCDYGPSMNVYPGPVFYNELTPEAVEEIVRDHLRDGRPVARWSFRPKIVKRSTGRPIRWSG